ncbi:hypothetical protein KJ761_02750 [Patescibacteria group bacterium]|nr:hypothetical protein [Patescibacteria group bacterium]
MEAYMTYVWYVVSVVGYIAVSIILLLLNKKWKWIYGNRFIEDLPFNLDNPIKVAELYKDPGLMVVLALLGPMLTVFNLVFAVGLWTIALCMTIFITFPRYLINR